ncbi:MAG: hypothetical protein KGS09_21770 [Nitrospirae bacterium]|nr:hypothetical protein [Nitrospirota bacterium]MBU6483149.1 hypothetical protein [Nitrospirota bacterium]
MRSCAQCGLRRRHHLHSLGDFSVPAKFTGKIHKVTVEVKEMKSAHAETEQHVVSEAHARKQAAD